MIRLVLLDLIDYDDFLMQACIEKRPELAAEWCLIQACNPYHKSS
jgi:hypothetical protein